MAKSLKLKVEKRELTGRKVKQLRRKGILPANIFGKGIKSKTIKLSLNEFEKAYAKVGETGILELQLGKSTHPALIANVAYDPVSDTPIHVDFKQINLKEKVGATVPVVLVGESPAEKNGEGTITQQINEIDVIALPTDLPEEFEVDITGLEKVDQTIKVADLKYDKAKLELDIDPELLIAKVEAPQEEEEPEPAAAEGETEGVEEQPKKEATVEASSESETSEEKPGQEKTQ